MKSGFYCKNCDALHAVAQREVDYDLEDGESCINCGSELIEFRKVYTCSNCGSGAITSQADWVCNECDGG